MTVESVRKATPNEIRELVTHVYDGLSEQDIDDVEAMARRRPFFTNSPE